MDWANEEYVRMYVRETSDDLELSWEALALWRALLCKFERSGLLLARNGWSSVARIVRMPDAVVERAGAELIADGRIVHVDGGLLAPNFTEAQTINKSDKIRQRESRDRRRAGAMSRAVTRGHTESHAVTPAVTPRDTHASDGGTRLQGAVTVDTGHTVSHGVTRGHAESQNVTLSVASRSALSTQRVGRREILAGDHDGYDHESAEHRGALAEWTWGEINSRRQRLAKEFGLPAPMPLAAITPAAHPPAFRDLLARVREEGAGATKACLHVVEAATVHARKERSIEWMAEKLCTEGGWRWARGQVPTWRTTAKAAAAAPAREYAYIAGERVEIS